jgi:hypothetical protein
MRIRQTVPSVVGRLAGVAVILALGLGAWASAVAANNPLDTIHAERCTAKSPGIKFGPCAEGGQAVSGIHDGDYLKYSAFDFDSGVAAFKGRIASTVPGTIEIRLDGPTGTLLGKCDYKSTGGEQKWQDVTCELDNSQSGVRDIYLVMHGAQGAPLASLSRFGFLKSVVVSGRPVDLSTRLDVEDEEPQATRAWGMPEGGFSDDFAEGMGNWVAQGIVVKAIGGRKFAVADASGAGLANTPKVYINKTDVGGPWRTMALASLAADITLASPTARPGIGFASKDGKQSVYVVLNPATNSLEAHRKLLDGSDTVIRRHPKTAARTAPWTLKTGATYRLQVDWSPYSNGLIALLHDESGAVMTSFRTVIDLPAARRPMIVCTGGEARFGNVKFDPTLDNWNYRWEWLKTPVLSKDVCNPAVWKGRDGKLYMMWRKFGQDNYHGVASSTDGIHWTRVDDHVIKCTGDMNIVRDPFGDGLDYITGGSAKQPWWTSDGSKQYTEWKKSSLTVGDIFGNCRIQEIIDTKRNLRMSPLKVNGTDYRFIALAEDWNRMPKPHTVVLVSNTLDSWVQADPSLVIPPSDRFWGEKGNAIGAAMALPDGNILISSCSCTHEGYTGAPEPSNVTAIVDGKQPWKILRLGTLPDAPVSRENIWYQGPNFGTAFYYDPDTDTLLFYGGFHDYEIGMMRVRNFLKSPRPGR